WGGVVVGGMGGARGGGGVGGACPGEGLSQGVGTRGSSGGMAGCRAVLEPKKFETPPLPLVMIALPAVLLLLKAVKPLFVLVMVALAAVLELRNCVTALVPLLVMLALPAVLLLANANSEVNGKEKVGAFDELLTMPAPVKVRVLAVPRLNE